MADDDTETDENVETAMDDENDSDYEVGQEKSTPKTKKLKRSKGKWKQYYDKKSFKKVWLELFPWVEEDPDDSKFAICRACNKKMKAHKGILETHQKTKGHLKNLSGSDDIEEEEDEIERDSRKLLNSKVEQKYNIQAQPSVEQILTDDQFSMFTESPIDSAHQAITSLIDKLVEKYHENRLENLKVQNKAVLQLNAERVNLVNYENQRKFEKRVQQEAYDRETRETHLKFMRELHETKINAMEEERDAKLKAVEQQLMFARQEYEKKVKLLDQQLQFIK